MIRRINKFLQRLAILLQVFWVFFPGILFLAIGYVFFTDFIQGTDILITGLRSRQTALFFIIGLFFWALITWYTSRLIAYNNDNLFHKAKEELYKTPRILGFFCFTIIIIALSIIKFEQNTSFIHLTIIFLSIILFSILHPLFEKIKNKNDRNKLLKYRKIIWLVYILLVIVMVVINSITTYIIILPIIQIGYLFVVVTRRKISQNNISRNKLPDHLIVNKARENYRNLIIWIFTDKARKKDPLKKEILVQTEKNIFFLFASFSFIGLIVYLSAIFSLSFSRYITSLPIIFLSFGILLGAGNILALFSNKQKINFHFLFITALVIGGYFTEPHLVQLSKSKSQKEVYQSRQQLKSYFHDWMLERTALLSETSRTQFPIYFVLADGGASRSAYWTASILSRLEKETAGLFTENLFCLSGASGGSLGNMAFYAAYQQNKRDSLLGEVQHYLSNDFLSFPLVRLMGPDILLPLLPAHILRDRAVALEQAMKFVPKENSISLFMQKNFSELLNEDPTKRKKPIICINCTRMQDGSPAVVSNIEINKEVFGSRIDVLKLLNKGEDISIATSVVLGARFPYFSPAGGIKNQYFVDGGYFDNSGAGVVHEMILELQKIINDSLKLNPNHFYKKIKFHVIHITNQPSEEIKIQKIHPLINDLAAPIKTIIGSYASQTNINDLRLYKNLLEIYKGDTTYQKINLYRSKETDSYPMNWSISDQSLKKMNTRLYKHDELDKLILNVKKDY